MFDLFLFWANVVLIALTISPLAWAADPAPPKLFSDGQGHLIAPESEDLSSEYNFFFGVNFSGGRYHMYQLPTSENCRPPGLTCRRWGGLYDGGGAILELSKDGKIIVKCGSEKPFEFSPISAESQSKLDLHFISPFRRPVFLAKLKETQEYIYIDVNKSDAQGSGHRAFRIKNGVAKEMKFEEITHSVIRTSEGVINRPYVMKLSSLTSKKTNTVKEKTSVMVEPSGRVLESEEMDVQKVKDWQALIGKELSDQLTPRLPPSLCAELTSKKPSEASGGLRQ